MSSSSIPSYPPELLWQGRAPDQNFDPDEPLYYRVQFFDGGGRVTGLQVRCPDTSVNRGKYSKPEHVLYCQLPNFLTWKPARFFVKDIPPVLKNPNDGSEFLFKIEHDPVLQPEENYSHSEIRCYKDAQRKNKLPSIVQKTLRQILAEAMHPV